MRTKYSNVAVIFHWLTVFLLLALFVIGWYMTDLEGAKKGFYYGLHKSLGLSIYGLVLFRLLWRVNNTPPPLPKGFSSFHEAASRSVHRLFYFFLLLMPIVGYLSSSFSGYKTSWFGVALFHWGWKHEKLNTFFSQIHVLFGYILIFLIALHLAAVIFHMFSKNINLLPRIWFHRASNINDRKD